MTQPDNSDDHAELGRIMFGEASEEEETAFLREHPDARTELSEGRTIIETLETARLVHEVQQTPPGEVPAAVLAKLEQTRAEASSTRIITPPASMWRRSLRPLAAVAAVLALVFVSATQLLGPRHASTRGDLKTTPAPRATTSNSASGISLFTPRGDIHTTMPTFIWRNQQHHEGQGLVRYRLTLTEVSSGRQLASLASVRSPISFDQLSLDQGLLPGAYRVDLTGLATDGSQLSTITVPFTVASTAIKSPPPVATLQEIEALAPRQPADALMQLFQLTEEQFTDPRLRTLRQELEKRLLQN